MEYTANVHVCAGENDEKKEKNHTENSINSINSLLLLCASQRRQTEQRKGEREKRHAKDNDFICCFNNNINTLLLNVEHVFSYI